MAILKKNAFSRRVPDLVTEELVAILSRRASFEFKQLFDVVHVISLLSGVGESYNKNLRRTATSFLKVCCGNTASVL